MIAVDTSALMAVVLGEAGADACMAVLEAETEVLVSAGTMAEALIVAGRRNVAHEMASHGHSRQKLPRRMPDGARASIRRA